MASMIRKIMRNVRRAVSSQQSAGRNQQSAGSKQQTAGMVRAGMHQKAEHEYRRAAMASDAAPEPETVEDALDMPGDLEAEIPPEEEQSAVSGQQADVNEEIAEDAAEIVPDEEILDDVADPMPEEPEEQAADSGQQAEEAAETVTLAVDYSGERIPDIEPLAVTGSVSPETELTYSPGDNGVKEIQEPLPGMGEKFGVPVKVNNADVVISVPETELEFGIDGDGHLIVSE